MLDACDGVSMDSVTRDELDDVYNFGGSSNVVKVQLSQLFGGEKSIS